MHTPLIRFITPAALTSSTGLSAQDTGKEPMCVKGMKVIETLLNIELLALVEIHFD